MGCCQQYELYSAEGVCPKGRTLTAKELQAYVDQLRENPWFERNFPQIARIEAYAKKSGRASVGGFYDEQACGVIEMLPVHMNELYVLHEISHVLAHARFNSHAHDPWFARIYLEAVFTYMGSEAYKLLADSFTKSGIDFDTDNMNPAGIPLKGQ